VIWLCVAVLAGAARAETERLYLHQSSEKAAKKAEGLAKLAQWKQDNPELVEAQQTLAKIKRKRKFTRKRGLRHA
jgi:hypothetical protein